RENPVGEGNLGAGALEQGAGDKYPKSKAAARAMDLVSIATTRQIGFADAFEHVRCNARAVVGDDDFYGLGIPPGIYLHRCPGEIDRVFQNVADAIQDPGVSRSDRL